MLLLFSFHPENLEGLVVGINDGDTITILVESKQLRIRLFGIDCPEKGQPFGKVAKQRVATLCYNEHVSVQTKGTDFFGRTLGFVFLADGRNLNHLLVDEGLAWWYRKYAPQDSQLKHAEEGAKKVRRGLWSDKNPVPPWEYRVSEKQVRDDCNRQFVVPVPRP
jgi:endonuclease YncB( thermonuclease family)